MHKLRTHGFTLIELLVVVSIIGILASIVLVSLDSTRKKGRDSKRISDIKQLQLALELFYDQNNTFPQSISTGATSCGSQSCASLYLTGPGYISVVPTDPSNGRDYSYVPYAATSGSSPCSYGFHLGASLETLNHMALSSDKDQATGVGAVCGGAGAPYAPSLDFNGNDFSPPTSQNANKCNSNDYGVQCYDVTP